MRVARAVGGACVVGALSVLSGCVGDDGGGDACLPELALDCAPAFMPTFEAFYDNPLSRTCGSRTTGSSCHGPEGGKAGLVLGDAELAYEGLLGLDGSDPVVLPGDPECSPLIRRIESDDPAFVMPPGQKLSEAERCAIRRWVADGAER